MSEANETVAVDDAPPGDDLRAQWARAEAIADAREAESGAADETTGDPESEPTPNPAHGEGSGSASSAESEESGEADDKAEGTVTVAERAKWREDKRKQRAAIAAERERAMAEIRAAADEVRSQYGGIVTAKKALEDGDFDGFAQALGYDDWRKLNSETLKRFQSPEYQRVQNLERQLKERTEREARERAEAQRASQQRAEQEQREQYIGSLEGELAATGDAALTELGKDPAFRRAVFDVQQREWDGSETVSVEEAARQALQSARSAYDRLHKIFGGQAALQPEGASAPAPRSGSASVQPGARRRASRSVTHAQAAEASPPGKVLDVDSPEWMQMAARRLNAAETTYPTR